MESLLEAHFRSWHVAHPAAHPTTAVSPDRPCRDGNRNRENMADSERLRSQVSLVVDPPLVHAKTEMRVRSKSGFVSEHIPET